ncbi:MAG: acylphosphatase [Cyanobacteria bacterium P01_G01_bin.19]
MKKIRAIVSGKVQQVAFRMYTQAKARELEVFGYVRNLSNGSVEIVALGESDRVDALIDWARSGSPSAVVKDLQIEVLADCNIEEFTSFEILR